MKKAFYPPLVAAFLVLALFNANIPLMTSVSDIGLPLLIVLALSGIVWLVLFCVFRSWSRAALPVCLVTIMLLEYGHIHRLTWLPEAARVVAWITAFTVLVLLSMRIKKMPTIALNVIAIVLVVTTLVPFGNFALTTYVPRTNNSVVTESSDVPDIYYIVMDEYSRDDVLLDMCNFDNSEFTDWLRDKGFYVADNSYTNYPHTITYLASTLNMNYLPEPVSLDEVVNLIDHNEVYKQLRQRGYTIIHINSWCSNNLFAESTDTIYSYKGWSEFFKLFIGLTPYPFEEVLARQYYNTALYQFDKLQEIPQMPEATFTFVHIMLAHAPYVFNADGSLRDEEDIPPTGRMFVESYIDQIQAANKLVQEAIDAILAEGNAVIILQGDTGTQPPDLLPYLSEHDGNFSEVMQDDPYIVWGRLANLNAIYSDCDYEFTSPVNTFRIIFNHYFDTDYTILPDRHFFEIEVASKPFEFFEVTSELREYGGE